MKNQLTTSVIAVIAIAGTASVPLAQPVMQNGTVVMVAPGMTDEQIEAEREAARLEAEAAKAAVEEARRAAEEAERQAREFERAAEAQARELREQARAAREQARDAREQMRAAAQAQKARERELERAYLEARRALAAERWEEASERFGALAEQEGVESGAPLYWRAYAEAQAGRMTAALEAIRDLFERFPRDVFVDDALALRMELARLGGELRDLPPLPPAPPVPNVDIDLGEAFNEAMEVLAEMDIGGEIQGAMAEAFAQLEAEWGNVAQDEFISVEDELRLLALEGLMDANPDRAVRYLEGYLTEEHSPAAKRQALFLLANSEHPQSPQILRSVITSSTDPALRGEALRMVGIALEKEAAEALLLEVYDDLDDTGLRRKAIEGLALTDGADALIVILGQEDDAGLRERIVRLLGRVDDGAALRGLYATEQNLKVKLAMLDGLAMAGDATTLAEIAMTSDDPEIVRRAIRALGVAGPDEVSAETLEALYRSHRDDPSLRQVVADTLVSVDGSDALVRLFRDAQDAQERRMLMQRLRAVGDDAAEQVFVEILEDGE